MYMLNIHSVLLILLFLVLPVYTHYCDQDMLHFHMSMVLEDHNSTCVFSWNIGYIAENYTHFHLYSDEFTNDLSSNDKHFDYCVKRKQMYLDIYFSMDCAQAGYINIFLQSVFIESIPFDSNFSHYIYYLNQTIQSSEYSLSWTNQEIYSMHSYIILSDKSCCIQFSTREICLKENQQYHISPPATSSIVVINRQRAALFIFPLIRHPSNALSYRSYHATTTKALIKDGQYCQIDIVFTDRMDWANGLVFSPAIPKSQLYILIGQKDRFHFVDIVETNNSTFTKFGYFLKESFARIRLVTTLVQYCNSQDHRIHLVSLNQLKPLAEEFHFFNRETLRLQLPCSSVFSYQILPQGGNTKQNKPSTLPYEVNPQTGLLTNKKPISGSFSVMGVYKQHNPLLSFYSIQPPSVTISLSVFYKDCSQMDLYRLVIEVKSQLPHYSRYLISNAQQALFLVENNRGMRTIIRPICSIGPELTFWNMDGASGSVTLFRGDLSMVSLAFSPKQSLLRLPLSIVHSKNYKERMIHGLTTREFTLHTEAVDNALLDLLVFSKAVDSITFNQQIFYSAANHGNHASFIRMFRPITSLLDKQQLIISYQKDKKELEVHSILHQSLYYDAHVISTSLFNDTMFITSLHHETFCLNAIQMELNGITPSFTVEMFQNSHWKEIGRVSACTMVPLPLVYQMANQEMSTQYRLHFDQSVEQEQSAEIGDTKHLPRFQFGYVMPTLWENPDVLTPGYRLVVVRDCYNWIALSDEDEAELQSALLLNYNLFFDWKHEVVFGTAVESVLHTFASRELDASLLSSRIQLVSCQSSQIQIELRSSSILNLSVYDDELLFAVPASLGLTSVTVCLDRDSYFTITSPQTSVIEMIDKESLIQHSLIVSPTPTVFSTFYTAASLLEYAMPAVSLQWQSIPFVDLVYNASFVYVRVPMKEVSSLLRMEVNSELAAIAEVLIGDKKILVEKEVAFLQLLVLTKEFVLKLRLVKPVAFNQFHSLVNLVCKEQTSIYEVISSPADLFYNPYHRSHASYSLSLLHPASLRYEYPMIVHVHNIQFCYKLMNASSLVLHIYVNCQDISSVLHNALLSSSNSTEWQTFSLTLPSPVYLSSLAFSFDFVPFSHSPDSQLLLSNLTLNTVDRMEVGRERTVIKEESKPLVEKLQTIAKEKEEVKPSQKKKPTVYCKEEKDIAHSIVWPRTPAVTHIRRSCPSGGKLHRFCDSEGKWGMIDGKCKKTTNTEDLLQRSFTRTTPSAPSKPAQPVQTPPVSFCEEETIGGVTFPSTMNNKTVTVTCKPPTYGTMVRTCSMDGTWETPIGECSTCPKNSFSFFNTTANELQCKHCPSGTAFIRGNPLNPVKCYGRYYSEGGTTDCLVCDGETRGNKEMGNIACKPCVNGVVVGMNCVNTTRCTSSSQSVQVGHLWYSACEDGMRGMKTQMCRIQAGTGYLGAVNREGCYNPVPAIGTFKMEIAFTLQNLHSSIFRKKYDDNKNIAASPAIQLIQQTVKRALSSFSTMTVQFVNYYDVHENNQFATIVHFVLEGKCVKVQNMTHAVFSTLQTRLPDVTMELKEQNAYIFHYYFIIKNLQIVWYDENKEMCEAEDGWPETPAGGVARKLCESPLQLGYITRSCNIQNNRVVWGAENRTLCVEEKPLMYTMKITLNSLKNQRVYERKEFFEKVMEDLNCDRIDEMLEMQLETLQTDFQSVFKDCRMEDDRLQITFLSKIAPTRDLLDFFASVGVVESVAVIQEGKILRASYALEFSEDKMSSCPSQYLFCNDKSILAGYYCHYHMYSSRSNK